MADDTVDTSQQVPEEAPKRRRTTRTRKTAPAESAGEQVAAPAADAPAAAPAEEKPKRRRTTRTRKAAEPADAAPAAEKSSAEKPAADAAAPAEEKPKRRRTTRARKAAADADTTPEAPAAPDAEKPAADAAPAEEKPKRRRATRARKAAEPAEAPADAPSVDEMTRRTQEHTQASAEVAPAPAQTVAEADAAAALVRAARRTRRRPGDRGEVGEAAPAAADAPAQDVAPADKARQKPVTSSDADKGDKSADKPADKADKPADKPAEKNDKPADAAEGTGRKRHRNRRDRDDRNGNGNGNDRRDRFDRNGRNSQNNQQGQGRNNRRNRRNNGPDLNAEPSLTREELQGMKVAELRAKATELGIDGAGVRKAELVETIYEVAARAEGFRHARGVLEIQKNEGYGFLRCDNYMQGPNDAFVFQQTIRQLGLRPGDVLEGLVVPNRSNSKYPPLARIDSVNGRDPALAKARPQFRDLTPIYPNERLSLESGRDSITGRAIDLVAPIGKGQRGLIVSPPKAGKTTVLKNICKSIAHNNPEVHLICLLVDERPEEVTDMQRSIRGEVVASTFDMPASNHTAVSELVIERAKRLVEQGDDVVVVLDSITRLARAYNLASPASGRILSGGVDASALYPPKKFLGAARNIENGGSLTIIASALVETGSKMDEVIFEEFKGTGNMELKLDRDLADKRVFPAIDPIASGTRNEELLIQPELQPFVWGIRRVLANMNNSERAAISLVKGLRATNSNDEFLIRSAKKAQMTDYTD